jgi:hypothetical protein
VWRDHANNQIPPARRAKKKEQKIFLTTIEMIPPAATAAFTAFPRCLQPPPADAVISTRSP